MSSRLFLTAVACAALSGLGPVSAARALPKLYTGTITVHAFGNDLTSKATMGTGETTKGHGMTSTCPTKGVGLNPNGTVCGKATTFAVKSYYAMPLNKYCHWLYTGSGPYGMYLGMGNPTDPCVTTPTFHRKSDDLTGSGTIHTGTTMIGTLTVPATPPAVNFESFNAGQIRHTGYGSFSAVAPFFEPEYPFFALSQTYAKNIRNGSGFLAALQGPGSFTAKAPNKIRGLARVTAGPNQFGGTLRLLGNFGSYQYRQNNGGSLTIGYRNWLWTVIGAACGANGCAASPFYDTFTTLLFNTGGFYTPTTVRAAGWPWTTGMVTVSATLGPAPTLLVRTGYDNRNGTGMGRIQLVTPKLTRWASGPDLVESGEIAILTLDFQDVPEPASLALLAAGVGLLVLLARQRRR